MVKKTKNIHEQDAFQLRLQYSIFLMSSYLKYLCQLSCVPLKRKKKLTEEEAFVLTTFQLFMFGI